MRPSGHLWRGDWRSDSERAGRAAEERRAAARQTRAEASPAAPPRAPAPARRSPLAGRARKLAAGGVLVGVLGVAFATGVLIGSDDRPKPLPAVSDGQVKPRSGQAPAGNVFADASPGVVSVRTDSGAGTGFLIDSGGTLVTNAHVVGGSERVSVRFGESEPLEAKVLGTDPSSDLAVLRADAGDLPASAKPLQFADSRNVHVGDAALAIGNPFGLDRTATAGIVSGLGRSIESPNGFSIDEVIQTDAPINPGNSGGPLLDSSARVIGVNSQIATSGASGNVGIGFAVPSNTVREVVPRLQRGEQIERAYLGLESSPAPPTGPSGAEVQTVIPGTPADRAGLEEGDIVTQIAGKTVHDPSDVSAAIADKQPGDGTLILVRRAGTTVALNATLGDRPAQTP